MRYCFFYRKWLNLRKGNAMNNAKKVKLPLACYLLLFSVLLAAVTGYGFPLRHFVEGEFGYLYIVMVIITGVIFLRSYEAVGSLRVIMNKLALRLGKHPLLFLFVTMVFLYIPGMFTGLGVPGVLISGGLIYPLLLKLNMSKTRAIAFITVGAMLGSVTGPINIPVMIIACGINMPYEGFGLVLPAITIPLGILTVFIMGLGPARKADKNAISQSVTGEAYEPSGIKVYLPLVIVAALLLLPRFIPMQIPDFGTPLTFIVGTVCAFLTGRKVKISDVLLKAVDSPILDTAALLLSVGVFVQIATLTGLKGGIVTACMSLSKELLYLVFLIVLPVIGGAISMLGAAALFGLPLVLALLGHNTIVVTAGCSVLCALSQIFPPTAIVGKVAGEIFGEEKYGPIFNECLLPVLLTAIFSLLFIIFSNPIARLLGVA
jgi:GntP family gluconate:H+ symporter